MQKAWEVIKRELKTPTDRDRWEKSSPSWMGWEVEEREAEEKVDHEKQGRGELQRLESARRGASDLMMGTYVSQ